MAGRYGRGSGYFLRLRARTQIPDGWPRGVSVTVNVAGTAIYPRDYGLRVEHNRGSTVPPIDWSQSGTSLSITLPTDTSIKTIFIYVDAKQNFIEADPGRTVIFTLIAGAGGSGTSPPPFLTTSIRLGGRPILKVQPPIIATTMSVALNRLRYPVLPPVQRL